MERCKLPPAGWYCTRDPNHEGPCAAQSVPDYSSGWTSPTLGRVYDDITNLRQSLAQPSESGIDESLRNLMSAIETADIELEAVGI